MAGRLKSSLVLFIGLTVCAAIAWGAWWFSSGTWLSNAQPQLARPRTDQQEFVGSLACRQCHAKQFESFSKHPMAQSLGAVPDVQSIEDYAAKTTFSPTRYRQYRVEKQNDVLVHHEIGLDRDGREIYDQAEEIRYVLGSGRRGRSYVLDRDGWLFMSPISWYSQKGSWDLSPGYEPRQHLRFDRRVPDRCLQCHAGRLNYLHPTPGADFERYSKPSFLEAGIGCERCHGPGARHIAWQTQSETRQDSDPMLQLSKLPAVKRDDVCNQCHLVGEFQVLRNGRSHGDFRPGDHVGDIWTVFVADTGVDESGATLAVSQVEQMQQSRCYVESRGQLGCISCHEPHSLPSDNDVPAYFDQRCSQCHQPEHCAVSMEERKKSAAQGSCIRCHMPRLSANDIPHTTQTDHRILRSPRAAPSSSNTESGQEFRIYELENCRLTDKEESRARGLFLAERAKQELNAELAQTAADLLNRADPVSCNDNRVWDALAFCEILAGHPQRATEFWSTAVANSADNPEILDSLAGQLIDRGEITRAMQLVDRATELDPWKWSRHLQRSKLLLQKGQLPAAIEAASQAVKLNPSEASIYQWLSDLHLAAGDPDKSQEFDAKRRQLQGLPPPRKN